MDNPSWHFDEAKAWLVGAIETLNTQIRDVAHSAPSASARNRGDEGIARWSEDVGRAIGTLEEAKKVILASLGKG